MVLGALYMIVLPYLLNSHMKLDIILDIEKLKKFQRKKSVY